MLDMKENQNIFKYIGSVAADCVGIGGYQRQRQRSGERNDVVSSLYMGIMQAGAPRSTSFLERRLDRGISRSSDLYTFPATLALETVVNNMYIAMAVVEGAWAKAIIGKLAYNILARVAPDGYDVTANEAKTVFERFKR